MHELRNVHLRDIFLEQGSQNLMKNRGSVLAMAVEGVFELDELLSAQ
jgi:hypothetical protein